MTTAKNLEEWNAQYWADVDRCTCAGATYSEDTFMGYAYCPKCGAEEVEEIHREQCGSNHEGDCPYRDLPPNMVDLIKCPGCGEMDA